MDTVQILHTLRNVTDFHGVFPSDMLPKFRLKSGTYIFNLGASDTPGFHWIAIRFNKDSSTGFYFDSYGFYPFVPNILKFIQKNCITWKYNTRQLQSQHSTVCGHYVCVFALYTSMGYTPQEFINMMTTSDSDIKVENLFKLHFGEMCNTRGGHICRPLVKQVSNSRYFS